MKTLLSCFLVIVTQELLCNAFQEDPRKICKDELKLEQEELSRFDNIAGDVYNDESYNTFIGCVWDKSGFKNKDGTVNFDNFVASFVLNNQKGIAKGSTVAPVNKDIVKGWLKDCRDLKGKDFNQLAVKVMNCLSKEVDKFAGL